MNKTTITWEEVIECESNLLSAQLTGNVDILNKLLHDDLVAMSPTGQILTKQMDIDSYKSGTVILHEASTEIEEIKITGNTAISVVTMKAKGKVLGSPLEGHFRYLRVWKRFDDSLKIIGAGFMQLS